MKVEDTGDQKETAEKGIQSLEAFFRSIKMPTSFKELELDPTEDEMKEMAHKCYVGTGGPFGSAKKLDEKDMLAIYEMAR